VPSVPKRSGITRCGGRTRPSSASSWPEGGAPVRAGDGGEGHTACSMRSSRRRPRIASSRVTRAGSRERAKRNPTSGPSSRCPSSSSSRKPFRCGTAHSFCSPPSRTCAGANWSASGARTSTWTPARSGSPRRWLSSTRAVSGRTRPSRGPVGARWRSRRDRPGDPLASGALR